jgi:hypothetical protein
MGFVQHIKEIFFVENGGQRNSQKENEKKKTRIGKKSSCFVALFVGVLTFSPNL